MRIGIDLGGTKIEGIAIAPDGAERCRRRIAAPRGDYEQTLTAIAGVVLAMESELGATAIKAALREVMFVGGPILVVLNYKNATGAPEAGATPAGTRPATGRKGRARRQPLKTRLEERFRRRYDQ